MAGKPRYRGVVPDGQVYCTRCNVCLPITDFASDRRKSNGLDSWCRSCHTANMRLRRASTPGGWSDTYLREIFGITQIQYVAMLAKQDGCCAICRSTVAWKSERLVNFSVDHDRACCPGKRSCGQCVRGLLCNACNRGLRQFKDDAEALRRAIAYLDRQPRRLK
jgi:hypothetical protein